MSQEIGYARVSKTEQHRALQLDALKKRGVVIVFTDKQTGVRFDREAFLAAMEYLNEGDTLVVWKLDRLVPSKESTFASCRMRSPFLNCVLAQRFALKPSIRHQEETHDPCLRQRSDLHRATTHR